MKWYYEVGGGHTHVGVFMNGAKCGDLCFRNEEFELVREACPWIQFIAAVYGIMWYEEGQQKTSN